MRLKVRVAKYNFGDGTKQVLRANTSGRLFRRTRTMESSEDTEGEIDEEDGNHQEDE